MKPQSSLSAFLFNLRVWLILTKHDYATSVITKHSFQNALDLELSKQGHRDQALEVSQQALEIFERIEDRNTAKVSRQIAEWKTQPTG